MLLRIIKELLLPFFTALGVILGGALVGSLATVLTYGSPLATMNHLAKACKLWAVVVAIGGTFQTIKAIEIGLVDGEVFAVARQFCILISAFSGALIGYWIIITLTGGD
ncbi:MAG: YtrH family sporulation protein [Limnochordia bacterium]|nr:YtrH family sporulation protein [Limnochordia bacterium]MDD2629541.1 YtrH family sporulation protein [Limnochordia bacterium]MDD4519049.1 YtrH family sporulation protein [Limnochordia bacterium]